MPRDECCKTVQRGGNAWTFDFAIHAKRISTGLSTELLKKFAPGSVKGRPPSVKLTDYDSRSRVGPSFYKGGEFHGSATLSRFADGAPCLLAPHSCRKPAHDFQQQAAHDARSVAAP